MNQIFDSTDESYSIRHLTGQVRSVIVTCPFNMRYSYVLCAPSRSAKTVIATETTFITG